MCASPWRLTEGWLSEGVLEGVYTRSADMFLSNGDVINGSAGPHFHGHWGGRVGGGNFPQVPD